MTYSAAAGQAVGYMLAQTHPCGSEALCIAEEGEVKLGGNALAILALVYHLRTVDDPEHLAAAQALARWIVQVQKENGAFGIHKMAFPDERRMDFTSIYYPGEAIYALAQLYELDRRREWLEAAAKNAGYLITERDRELKTDALPHDHWLLYGLAKLARAAPAPLWKRHGLRIARGIIATQNRDATPLDWTGSFYRPPRSTPTATRTEGLGAAYALASDNDHGLKEAILDAYCRGVGFQLQTQFHPEKAMYLSDPRRVLGGFHRSLTDYEIRIDYNQHNISSLLGLHAILKASGKRCSPVGLEVRRSLK